MHVDSRRSPMEVESALGSAAASAPAVLGGDGQGRDVSEAGCATPKELLFTVGATLTSTMGGGLLLGTAPFQDSLVRCFGYTEPEASTVVGWGFQILIFGTAVLGPVLDVVGPRCFAATGSAIACAGHFLLSSIQHTTKPCAACALGLVGLGGNMVAISSIQFSELFVNSATATTFMSGTYQAAGFAFVLLTKVEFTRFFAVYTVFTLVSCVAVVQLYPDVACSSPDDRPRVCRGLPSCAPRVSRGSGGGAPSLRQAIRGAGWPLGQARTWCFLAGFSWTATCSIWGLMVFYTVAEDSRALVKWMPLVANSTFIFAPCIGAVIDRVGFGLPVMVLGSSAVAFSLAVWGLPLQCQWFSLVLLNLLQAHVYGIQMSYIALTYPIELFGLLMSMSTLAQSAVNPLAVSLAACQLSTGALVFVLPVVPICALWALVQRRLRLQGSELAQAKSQAEVVEAQDALQLAATWS